MKGWPYQETNHMLNRSFISDFCDAHAPLVGSSGACRKLKLYLQPIFTVGVYNLYIIVLENIGQCYQHAALAVEAIYSVGNVKQ